MKEIVELRDVEGYPGIKITKEPQVVSLIGEVKILKIFPPAGQQRYCKVHFYGKKFSVHHLVAAAFPELVLGEKKEGYELDHINGDRSDNRPENLRWVTHRDNINNPITKWKIGRKKKPVFQWTISGELVGVYSSAREAAFKNGYPSRSTITACCNGKRHSAYKYLWSYGELPHYKKYVRKNELNPSQK